MLRRFSPSVFTQRLQAFVDLRRSRRLAFPDSLEKRFERDTRLERSARLWREGLISILAFATFYAAQWLLSGEVSRHELLVELGIIAPMCVAVNLMMCFNPPRLLREGSVALLTCMIACSYLWLQQGKRPVSLAYTAVGTIVTALFASVVMRLRFRFALTTSIVIAIATIAFFANNQGLHSNEKLTGGCLTVIAIGIGMVSNFESEWEERLSYLRHLENERRGHELSALNERLAELSSTDILTGLLNRRAYEDRFAALWSRLPPGGSLSVVMADVDHFKMINDAFGHAYGDEVLQRVGSLLKESLRSQEDCVARYGGEEFVALLPGADAEAARTVAERMRHLVEIAGSPPQSERSGEALMWVTVSCGFATCSDASRWSRKALLEAADRALYEAKGAGRNRVALGALLESKNGGAVELHALAATS